MNRKTQDAGQPATTILVAEDEVLVRHDISEYLRSQGYSVVEANNAAEAIAAVFTDIRMPGTIDGLDLARYVQSHYPGVPVVITSGHVRAADIPADLGPIIVKPYNHADVLRLSQNFKSLARPYNHNADEHVADLAVIDAIITAQ